MSEARPVTMLLRRWRGGDDDALEALAPLVYDELRRLAANHVRRERAGVTLSPTDLVSEAFLRLVGDEAPDFQDRVHFFAAAARHMRLVLVDHARRRAAGKRGGGLRPVTLDEEVAAEERPDELLALDAALAALAAEEPRKARVVELHFFGGMTLGEIAAALDVHQNTVLRDLRVAEAWLNRALSR